MAAWPGWETQLLGALSAPDTSDNRRFLDDWQRYEGGTATNNPLNTTQSWPGSTRYNSVGVRNYRTRADGIQATVATLTNGHYPDIVAALRSGNPYTYAQPVAVAAELRTWGTGTFAAVYQQATATPQPGGTFTSTPTVQQVAPHAFRGYADLRNSLGRHLPTQLERSRKTGETTLKILARNRKVGR